jgi:UDP-GlcNAc:undecaprenyl-phosphate/decaprenyl-phosphate GlcNAc-1-phosphate transferase
MRTYLGLFFLAAFTTLLVTPRIRTLGRRLNAYGGPSRGRKSVLTPRLGGLAIFVSTLAAWCVLMFVPNEIRARFLSDWQTVVLLLIPATMVLMLGAYDDVAGIAAWQKLLIEVLAADLIWWAGFRIDRMPVLGFVVQNPVLSFFITALWIVAVTNAFNLIDGLDGLAAGIAFFVTLCVFIVSLIQQNYFVCILSITLAGALLGFLRFNFVPASIFLGDTGSLFLGFILGALAILTSQKGPTLVAIVVPYVAFGLPLLDTSLSVVRRFLGGQPIFVPDTDHIHHRLLKRSHAPQAAVLALYGLAAMFSLGSLLIIHSTGNLVALVAVLVGVVAWFLTRQLGYEELAELNVYVSRAVQSQRKVLANQILIRKTSKRLEEAEDLETSWRALGEALKAMDFDGAACHLTTWHNGSAPRLIAWPGAPHHDPKNYWMVCIPLRAGEKTLGDLQVWRAMRKDRMLFQFSSLLDTLIPSFETQLRRRYIAEVTHALPDTEEMPALQEGVLPSGEEA